jgi:uncharacterized RDD family membrane protein YckC
MQPAALPTRIATIDKRIKASLIDHLQMLVVCILFSLVFGKKEEGLKYTVEGNIVALPFIWWMLYFVVFEWLLQGTIGKRVMGLKLATTEGGSISLLKAIQRRLLDPIELWGTLGVIGLLKMHQSPYKQRLGDEWAGTVVTLQDDKNHPPQPYGI